MALGYQLNTKTDKRPKEGELPKNIVKLDPPGLRMNDLDEKVLKAAGRTLTYASNAPLRVKIPSLLF